MKFKRLKIGDIFEDVLGRKFKRISGDGIHNSEHLELKTWHDFMDDMDVTKLTPPKGNKGEISE